MLNGILKKTMFLTLVILFSLVDSFAQNVKEPEFLGEIFLLQANDGFVKLSKEAASIKSKSSGLAVVPLMGSVKSFISIKGPEAEVRVSKESKSIQFIVKCENNSSNPEDLISLVQFEKKKKERRYLMGKTSVLGGSEMEGIVSLPYEAEKFGESSYKITVTGLEPGEYGIFSSEQSTVGAFYTFRCFGID